MATTLGTARTQLRTRLGESAANEWADDTLLTYIQRAEVWLANLIGRIPNSGRFRYKESMTLSANSDTIATTGLTKRFGGIRTLYMILPGGFYSNPLVRIDETEEDLYRGSTLYNTASGNTVPAYLLRDPNVVFIPIATEARTIVFDYRYLPTAGKAAGADLETPDDYLDALITRAVHFALADVGEANGSFENEHAAVIDEITYYEVERSREGAGDSVRSTSTISLW